MTTLYGSFAIMLWIVVIVFIQIPLCAYITALFIARRVSYNCLITSLGVERNNAELGWVNKEALFGETEKYPLLRINRELFELLLKRLERRDYIQTWCLTSLCKESDRKYLVRLTVKGMLRFQQLRPNAAYDPI